MMISKRVNSWLSLILLCLFFCIGVSPNLYAQDVQPFEGEGPLFERHGGYPPTIWQDLSREMLHISIENWPEDMSAVDRSIARRALLTPATPKTWQDETPIDKRQDFLSFRIKTLLRLGQFEDALRLYQHPKPDALPAPVHKAGVLAALFNGDKDLACLIEKTTELDWPRLSEFCADLLAPPNDEAQEIKEDQTKLQEADAFLAMDLEEKAFAFAASSVALTKNPAWDKALHPIVLRYLLRHPDTSDHHKFIAHFQLLDYGLTALNTQQIDALDIKTENDLSESILLLLEANLKSIKDKATKEQKKAFHTVIKAHRTLPYSLLDRLLGFHSLDIYEVEYDLKKRFDLALLYMHLGKPLPRFADLETESDESFDEKIPPEWIIRVLNENEKISSTDFKNWFNLYCMSDNPLFSNHLCINIWLLTRNTLTETDSDHSFYNDYEKFLFLTKQFDYVMHSIGVAGIYPVVGQDRPHGINVAVTPMLGLDNLYKMPFQQFKAVLETLNNIINKDQKKRIIAKTTQLWKERN